MAFCRYKRNGKGNPCDGLLSLFCPDEEWRLTMRFAAIAVCCIGLAGCAGGSPDSLCEVIDPPPVQSPTAQNDQRIEMQSTGDPTAGTAADMQDCP